MVNSIYILRAGIRHERAKLNISPDCIQTLERNMQQLAVHEDKGQGITKQNRSSCFACVSG